MSDKDDPRAVERRALRNSPKSPLSAPYERDPLKEFGIKSKQEGDKVKFTFQGVTTEVSKNAADIEKYLQGIGNNQFAGAMERQTATLAGAWAGLTDQIFLAFAAIGEGDFSKSIADKYEACWLLLVGLKWASQPLTSVFASKQPRNWL